MASFDFSSFEGLALSMHEIAEIPEDILAEMTMAGAEVAAEAQKVTVRRLNLKDTGQLERSIKSHLKQSRSGGFSTHAVVYPAGKRKNGVRTAEVGFIHEYGAPKRRIPAKQWMRTANESCADAVAAAELSVYDRFLESKNL